MEKEMQRLNLVISAAVGFIALNFFMLISFVLFFLIP